MNNPQQPLEYDAVLGGENQISSSHDLKMTTERAINLLKAGTAGIKAWNLFRKEETYIPSLEGVDLSGQDLTSANLQGVNLKNSKLVQANLTRINLINADLQ
ncbi:MAG: pentapeptide repeat-containing protein [Dolichospermum sp.]